MSKGKFYVYALSYPEDYSNQEKAGTIFYIGKGSGERIKKTLTHANNNSRYKNRVIHKIQNEGKRPIPQILASFATEKEANMLEIALIFLIRPYGNLTNLTDGGEGTVGFPAHNKGKPLSEKQKQKLSEVRKGKSLSAETRRKISEAGKRRSHSVETRQKMSEARKGIHQSAEARHKLSEAHKGKTLSAETRHKLSEAHKGKTPSIETRRKMSETSKNNPIARETLRKNQQARIGKHLSVETRRKISEARKRGGNRDV